MSTTACPKCKRSYRGRCVCLVPQPNRYCVACGYRCTKCGSLCNGWKARTEEQRRLAIAMGTKRP